MILLSEVTILLTKYIDCHKGYSIKINKNKTLVTKKEILILNKETILVAIRIKHLILRKFFFTFFKIGARFKHIKTKKMINFISTIIFSKCAKV